MRTLTAVIVCLPSVGVLVFGLSGDLLDGKLVESGPEHFLVDLYEAFFFGGGYWFLLLISSRVFVLANENASRMCGSCLLCQNWRLKVGKYSYVIGRGFS